MARGMSRVVYWYDVATIPVVVSFLLNIHVLLQEDYGFVYSDLSISLYDKHYLLQLAHTKYLNED